MNHRVIRRAANSSLVRHGPAQLDATALWLVQGACLGVCWHAVWPLQRLRPTDAAAVPGAAARLGGSLGEAAAKLTSLCAAAQVTGAELYAEKVVIPEPGQVEIGK